jgi:hypothetical protein
MEKLHKFFQRNMLVVHHLLCRLLCLESQHQIVGLFLDILVCNELTISTLRNPSLVTLSHDR